VACHSPKASAEDKRISGLESQIKDVQERKKQIQGRFQWCGMGAATAAHKLLQRKDET
jgi:hypothetical protein